mgnify:FL=1
MGIFLIYNGINYLLQKDDGVIESITDDAASALIDAGTPVVNAIGQGFEAIGEGLSELGSDIGDAALKVLRRSGIAVIEGAEDIFDYTYNKVAPYRVETVTAVTAMLIYSITALTIFKKIRAN